MNKTKEVLIWICNIMLRSEGSVHSVGCDSHYHNIKPILHSMRIFGRLPMQITDEGLESCSIISWPWIYSIISMSIQIALTIFAMIGIYENMVRCEDYDEYLFWIMLLTILSLNLIAPVTYWVDSACFATYLNEWIRFQVESIKANQFGVRHFIILVSVLNLPCIIFFACFEIYLLIRIPLIGLLPYVLMLSTVSCISIYWSVTCYQLIQSASLLLSKTILAVRKDNAGEIRDCRFSWLKLSELGSGLGSSLTYSYLTTVIAASVSFVICAYACMSVFFNSLSSHYITGSAMEAALTFFLIFLIFDFTNRVTKKIGSEFGAKLLALDFSKCSPTSTNEINSFLQSIIVRPPIVKLADFFTVDRTLITHFIGSVITYLIVLLQFRDSGLSAIKNYHKSISNSSSHQSLLL